MAREKGGTPRRTHEPRVHTLLEKLRRSKEGFEPAADDVQRAVRHERRAREQAQDQIIAEPVEVARRVEAPRAPRHPLSSLRLIQNRIQNSRVCCPKLSNAVVAHWWA